MLRRVAPRNDDSWCRSSGPSAFRFKFQTAAYLMDTVSRSRGARARVLRETLALEIRGRRECRARAAPAASCVKMKNTRVNHHGCAGSPGIPRAMVLTVSSALSPVTGLVCHRRRRKSSANLTPASGRQNHTASPSASSAARLAAPSASIASRPAFVTIASRPFVGRDRIAIILFLPRRQAKFGKSEIGPTPNRLV